jgi:hypothetical protein
MKLSTTQHMILYDNLIDTEPMKLYCFIDPVVTSRSATSPLGSLPK